MGIIQILKQIIKPIVPKKVLALRRRNKTIKVLCGLLHVLDFDTYILSEQELDWIKGIKDAYKKIYIVSVPWRNIGGMGLMFQWFCVHREKGALYLFYREKFNHSTKCPNDFLGAIIGRNMLYMEENPKLYIHLCKTCFEICELLDFGVSYRNGIEISRQFFSDRHCYLYDKNSNLTGYFTFEDDEEKKGKALLAKLGIKSGKYVCIFARDSEYYNRFYDKTFNEQIKWANDLMSTYRDADIDTFQVASAFLKRSGLNSVRMGAIATPKSCLENIIDYTNEARTDFGDVYVFSHCKFFLGDPSGVFIFPLLAKKPIAFTNCSAFFNHGDSQTEGTLAIYKIFYNPTKDKWLTLREILELHVKLVKEKPKENLQLIFWKWLAENGYVAVNNSETDISELTEEMLNVVDNNISYTDEEMILKKRYKEIVYEYIVKDDFLSLCADVGAKWIVKNKWFLE